MAYAELTDVRCHYRVQGSGAPLLLVAGLGRTIDSWNGITPTLSEHYSVISVDNRDIGRSIPRRYARGTRDYSSDLIELLDHLQVDRVHVMGVSLGGIIAQQFVIDFPDRVDRLVLMSCAQHFTPYLREMLKLMGQTLRRFPRPAFFRMMEVLTAGPPYLDAEPNRIDENVRHAMANRVPARTFGRQLRALSDSYMDPREYRIQAPALVICGEFDPLIPHCYGRRMADMIDDSAFVLLEDAGHNPLTECPQRVLPMIISFLEDDGPAADPTQRDRESVTSEPVSTRRH